MHKTTECPLENALIEIGEMIEQVLNRKKEINLKIGDIVRVREGSLGLVSSRYTKHDKNNDIHEIFRISIIKHFVINYNSNGKVAMPTEDCDYNFHVVEILGNIKEDYK